LETDKHAAAVLYAHCLRRAHRQRGAARPNNVVAAMTEPSLFVYGMLGVTFSVCAGMIAIIVAIRIMRGPNHGG
jgi:hypothetical protein